MRTENRLACADNSGDETIPTLPAIKNNAVAQIPLPGGSLDSDAEIALSISSVNDCGNHLLEGMRSLRKTDAAEIMSACEVAKQIVQLARTKVELLKLKESLK